MKRTSRSESGAIVIARKFLRRSSSISRTSSCAARLNISLGPHIFSLPLPVIFKTFSNLPLASLTQFCYSSKEACWLVELFSRSFQAHQLNFLGNGASQASIIHSGHEVLAEKALMYKNAGRLYRAMTLLLPTHLRLAKIMPFVTQHLCQLDSYENLDLSGSTTSEESETSSACSSKCPAMSYIGHFLFGFLSGWTESEVQRAFQELATLCFEGQKFHEMVETIFLNPCGAYANEEVQLRFFLRRLFLDPIQRPTENSWHVVKCRNGAKQQSELHVLCEMQPIPQQKLSDDDSGLGADVFNDVRLRTMPSRLEKARGSSDVQASSETSESLNFSVSSVSDPLHHGGSSMWFVITYWLENLLRHATASRQARLLVLLYGPIHRKNIMWQSVCENTAADESQVRVCFNDLGWIFRCLCMTQFWSPEHCVSVMQEVFATPSEWLSENIACLLYCVGPELSSKYVVHRARNGKCAELAITLTSLCLVFVKMSADLDGALYLVQETCAAFVNSTDRHQFLDFMARTFHDVIIDLYETDEIEERLDDLFVLLRAQSKFVRSLLSQVFETDDDPEEE